jgi:hypothetical protein
MPSIVRLSARDVTHVGWLSFLSAFLAFRLLGDVSVRPDEDVFLRVMSL